MPQYQTPASRVESLTDFLSYSPELLTLIQKSFLLTVPVSNREERFGKLLVTFTGNSIANKPLLEINFQGMVLPSKSSSKSSLKIYFFSGTVSLKEPPPKNKIFKNNCLYQSSLVSDRRFQGAVFLSPPSLKLFFKSGY